MLLDTCTLIWLASDPRKLSNRASSQIKIYSNTLFISAISAFEIGVLVYRKKLLLPMPTAEWVSRTLDHHGIAEIPIDINISLSATELPRHHNDPFDRIIIATSVINTLQLLSPDKEIAKYSEARVVW